jgi:branched-chain amino acid transport system ATP-binding protein
VVASGQPALTDAPLLELTGIVVRFGGIRAVDDVNLQVAAGEVLGLIGPNGAGKTTLFDVIAGARAPDEGRVVLDGRDVTRTSPVERAQHGMRRTFQRVQTFGWLTVEDNVLAATEWHGGGGGFLADVVGWPGRRRREHARRAHVAEVLARCGLEGVKDELAGSLPIGTARMVELARAIADRPRLLLLDEPASGLDETEAARLGALIHQVRDESGCAIVLVEHDAGFVMRHCARIVVLDQGHVLSEGAPREIQNDQRVRDAYLGEGAGVGAEANEN